MPRLSFGFRDPMNPQPDIAADSAEGSLLALAALALVVGALSGLIGALFRLALAQADAWRDALIAWAHGAGPAGILLVMAVCAAAAAGAAWLVRRYERRALGSGIPDVEAVLHQELQPAPFRLIPVKFFGGLLAIGGGLALGREGPSVQMAAIIGRFTGLVFRRSWPDCRVLLAAGAGAGLATAFNAPIAGAIFVLEELVRKFELRIAIAALGASATAISVARVLLGDAPDFQVPALAPARIETMPLYFALGAATGLAAVAYNRTLLAALAAADRLGHWPVELRAGLIGAAVGLLAWFAPGWSAAATRSPSARSSAPKRCCSCRSRSCCASGSARSPTPPARLAGCSRRCSRSARNSACCSVSSAAWHSRALAYRAGRLRRRRHGRLLHRRGARAAHRHRAGHRDDRERRRAAVDAGGVLRGHAGAHAAARSADLRLAARAHGAAHAGRG